MNYFFMMTLLSSTSTFQKLHAGNFSFQTSNIKTPSTTHQLFHYDDKLLLSTSQFICNKDLKSVAKGQDMGNLGCCDVPEDIFSTKSN
jgi:hypothetical protein